MAGNPLQTFNCPGCGAPVQVRALGRSLSVVCSACGSVLDANSPQHEILSRFELQANRYKPVIPLGSRGTLRGVQLECVGFMIRSDRTDVYSWEEYLLYNPQQGFRWLVLQNGHCLYVTPLKAPPVQH